MAVWERDKISAMSKQVGVVHLPTRLILHPNYVGYLQVRAFLICKH